MHNPAVFVRSIVVEALFFSVPLVGQVITKRKSCQGQKKKKEEFGQTIKAAFTSQPSRKSYLLFSSTWTPEKFSFPISSALNVLTEVCSAQASALLALSDPSHVICFSQFQHYCHTLFNKWLFSRLHVPKTSLRCVFNTVYLSHILVHVQPVKQKTELQRERETCRLGWSRHTEQCGRHQRRLLPALAKISIQAYCNWNHTGKKLRSKEFTSPHSSWGGNGRSGVTSAVTAAEINSQKWCVSTTVTHGWQAELSWTTAWSFPRSPSQSIATESSAAAWSWHEMTEQSTLSVRLVGRKRKWFIRNMLTVLL